MVTNCMDGRVLGVITGALGGLQVLEVLKIAAGLGPQDSGNLLLFHARADISAVFGCGVRGPTVQLVRSCPL